MGSVNGCVSRGQVEHLYVEWGAQIQSGTQSPNAKPGLRVPNHSYTEEQLVSTIVKPTRDRTGKAR